MLGVRLFGTSLLLGLSTVLFLGGDWFVEDEQNLLVGTDVLEETTGETVTDKILADPRLV